MRPSDLMNDVTEVIYGVEVREPYRWLESRTSSETEDWIRLQQRRYQDYGANCQNRFPETEAR